MVDFFVCLLGCFLLLFFCGEYNEFSMVIIGRISYLELVGRFFFFFSPFILFYFFVLHFVIIFSFLAFGRDTMLIQLLVMKGYNLKHFNLCEKELVQKMSTMIQVGNFFQCTYHWQQASNSLLCRT